MVKYWDKYTAMHGQQNVRTAICLPSSTPKYSQQIFRRCTYEETTKWNEKGKEITEDEKVEDKTNREEKNKTEK